MSKRMIVIAVAVLSLAICDGANGEVINFFAPSAPSGPSMPGAPSPTDTLAILNSAGSMAYDGNGDGWADAAPSRDCNPMGYLVMHPSSRWQNVYLCFHDWGPGQAPFWIGGGGGGGGSGAGGGMRPQPWDFNGFDSLFDYEFGFSENPDPGNPGDFGVGEGGVVPEPCSLALLILGAAGLILRRTTVTGYWAVRDLNH